MSNIHPQELIFQAKSAVSAAGYSPPKLTLIHTGVTAVAGLAVSLLSYLLSQVMGQAGGLSGLSSQAMLQTAQTVLELAVTVFSPFWAMGFVAAALHLARRQDATPRTLTSGLRRWGPILRLLILEGLIYLAVIMAVAQAGSIVYTLTPLSQPMSDLMEQLLAAGTTDPDALTEILMGIDSSQLLSIVLTMLPFVLLPVLAAALYISYRLRFASYVLMDNPHAGAIVSLLASVQLTKGNFWTLLKLDLRYWWFYLLELVIALVPALQLLSDLSGAGIRAATLSVLLYVVSLLGQLALYAWKKPQVMTTYALLYDRLFPEDHPRTAQ